MRAKLALIAVLVAFDVALALATTLNLVAPGLAVALLLTNPLALFVDHRLRARRAVAITRSRRV